MQRVAQHIDPAGVLHQLVADPAGDLLQTRIHRQSEWAREGSYEGAAYRFDCAGNLISRHDAHGELTLAWDADQKLVESRRDNVATTYGYDAFGRRIFKQTADRKTVFHWDGDALAGESTREHSHECVYYPERFEPFSRIDTDADGKASIYYYHNDPNGCPAKITDKQGEVQWAVSYSVWGKVTRQHASATGNALRLQGQYFDEETGLHYNRHRYYDPHIGQFVSADPLRLAAGENLFRFASNPFSWIDPQGLACNTWNEFQKHHKGKFKTPGEAAAAYHELVTKQSPWPINHTPATRVMTPGEQFNMAMSPGQPSTRPGGFGTLDDIADVDYVRNELAVKQDWKPAVDRVVTYEVTQPLPVKEGPVGPQVDKTAVQYLKGGGSQVEMQVPPAERMKYLKIVDEKTIS
jgi:RHS repeat-associated protein